MHIVQHPFKNFHPGCLEVAAGGSLTISGKGSNFKPVASHKYFGSDFDLRAIAEELAEERGGFPEGSDKSDFDLKTLKKKADLGRPDFAGKGDKSFWYFFNSWNLVSKMVVPYLISHFYCFFDNFPFSRF